MIDNLTLDQMRTFAAAAQTGSFRGAAQQLHRVQSAVSHAIGNLEEQLGVQLFDRAHYRPALTPAGEALLSEVRVILAQVDGLKARARELHQGVELQLSVAVDSLFSPDLVALALKGVQTLFPNVAVRLECVSLGGTLDALRTGRCTVAIAVFDQLDDEISRDFLMPLATEAVVAPGHPLARLGRTPLRERERLFEQHLQIVVEDASQLTRGQDFGVLSPRTWRTGDMHTKLALLRAGVGWGSLPAWLVQAELAAGTLVRLPANTLGPQGQVGYRAYFSHRRDQALGPAARALRERLIEAAAERR